MRYCLLQIKANAPKEKENTLMLSYTPSFIWKTIEISSKQVNCAAERLN